MQIIVTGHGRFASGIESTVKLLAGKIDNVTYIDFTENMGEEELAQRFYKQFLKDDQVLFFCDLLGGTPYKQAVMLKMDNQKSDIAVVCGCNVGSLLENGLRGLDNFKNTNQLAKNIIDSAKNGIKQFGLQSPSEQNQAESDQEGI